MRVYNLTDVPTTALRANGLVAVSVRVGPNRQAVMPGHFVDVIRLMPVDQRLLGIGAIVEGRLPQTYLMAKAKLAPPVEPTPTPEVPTRVVLEIEDNVMVDDTVNFAIVDAIVKPESESDTGSYRKKGRGKK